MKNFDDLFKYISSEIGMSSNLIKRNFIIGNNNLESMLIYMKGIVDTSNIDEYIIKPLMSTLKDDFTVDEKLPEYLLKKFIIFCDANVSGDMLLAIESIKTGKTVLFFQDIRLFIIFNTTNFKERNLSEPDNETSIRGAKDGFVENFETNLDILKKIIKDKNLTAQFLKVGSKSQTTVSLVYLDDVVNPDVLNLLLAKIKNISTDSLLDSGSLAQLIEDNPYSPFPQAFYSERPDRIKSQIMSGKIAVIVDGCPSVLTLPCVFLEFFQIVDDYNSRTLVSSLFRFLRFLAFFVKLTLSPIYLSLISQDSELIPLKFLNPIIQSRIDIPLTPFLEILTMEIIIEFLKEGSLIMPNKIGPTLSIAGGLIIGQTAIQSKIVSPTTLLIIGIGTIVTSLIPNYELGRSIRFLKFPMLLLAQTLGLLGVSLGLMFLFVHLCSLKVLNVPYFDIFLSDFEDSFIRAPITKLKSILKAIPTQKDKE